MWFCRMPRRRAGPRSGQRGASRLALGSNDHLGEVSVWQGVCPAGRRREGREGSCIGQEEPAHAIVKAGGRPAGSMRPRPRPAARAPFRRPDRLQPAAQEDRGEVGGVAGAADPGAGWCAVPAGGRFGGAPAADGRRVRGRPGGRRSAQVAGRSSSFGGSTTSARRAPRSGPTDGQVAMTPDPDLGP
jgi:hypothetical protein